MDFGFFSLKRSGADAATDENRAGSGPLEGGLRPTKFPKLEECGGGFDSSGRSSVVWPSPPEEDGRNLKMLCFASSEPPPPLPPPRSMGFSISQGDHCLGGGGGPFSRIRSPFTPSQRLELENQAWIYKHLAANVPVPSHLPLALENSLCIYGPSQGSYPSNLLGWGVPFQLGYSGSNDPEQGRCRRTDGKKWRCSRDAVPDGKYCERHVNRGRHRSRKHVEAARQSNNPVIESRSLVSSDGGGSCGLGALEARAPSISLKPKEISFEGSSGFGLVSPDYATTTNTTNPYWHQGLNYDWTQLSMSIPDLSSQERALMPPAQHEPAPVNTGLALFEPVRESNGLWLPVVDGPLGEVLTTATATTAGSTNGNSLHLLSGSSPTGVLQRSMMFGGGGSISNSNSDS